MSAVFLGILYLCFAVIAYWYLMPKKAKNLFLLVISFIFISAFSPIYALYYLVLITFVYVACFVIRQRPDIKKPLFIATFIVIVANLLFFKYFRTNLEFFNRLISCFMQLPLIDLPSIVFPLGLSFITFRLLHYLIEVNRDNIPETSFVDFALYSIFFPVFLAGPIERFPRFYEQTKKMSSPDYNMFCYGLWRVWLGIVKKFVIADILFSWVIPVLNSPGQYGRLAAIASVYGAAILLYMDFSGYTDMAIGISCLFGYRIVENFNRPFWQKNIAQFWRSWHISLYTWIRDYFYFPLFVYRGTPLKLYLGGFLTIMFFMFWHRISVNFLLAGVFNGLGLTAWVGFQQLKRRFPGLKSFFGFRYLAVFSIFITFTYVCFGIGVFFFCRDLSQINALVSRIFLW